MLVKEIQKLPEIIASDGCRLKEVASPLRQRMKAGYSVAYAKVRPGQETLLHRLRATSEAYFILKGAGRLTIGGESRTVRQGAFAYIPPGSPQKIRNTGKGDLVFLCIVSPPWQAKNEEKLALPKKQKQ